MQQTVDVIVCAAANALQTDFAIYQNIGGKAVSIYTNCSKIATNKTIYVYISLITTLAKVEITITQL